MNTQLHHPLRSMSSPPTWHLFTVGAILHDPVVRDALGKHHGAIECVSRCARHTRQWIDCERNKTVARCQMKLARAFHLRVHSTLSLRVAARRHYRRMLRAYHKSVHALRDAERDYSQSVVDFLVVIRSGHTSSTHVAPTTFSG